MCYDGVTQGSMLGPPLLSNYPDEGRLGLQEDVRVATQGVSDYLRVSALMKNVAGWWELFALQRVTFYSERFEIKISRPKIEH